MAKKPSSDSAKPRKQRGGKQGQTAQQATKVPAIQEYDSPWKEIIELFFPHRTFDRDFSC
jgi:hypothetical protein